ncbi:MAG: putative DNA binding domain-containing protein [Methylibium sp.]|nr:putative DNA binding domain-containing protein [Methylibium sp.]
MNAREILEALNVLDEHERVEAKRASEVGKSLLESVCAFANEPGLDGGWLLLGVVREDLALFPSYEVEGLSQPDKLSADLASQCRTEFNTPVRVDIAAEEVEGKAVLVVRVPEAPPHDKPVYFKRRGLPAGAMRRIGSVDQHCTDDDLLVLYQGRQQDSFDAGIVPDASLDDLAPEALADYRQSRAEVNPDAEELRWSDEELLQSLGAIRRTTGGAGMIGVWQPTVAGLLLFGKAQALRRCFPMTRVDYVRVPGREWVPDPERRFDTIELRDPLFRLVRRAQAAVLDDLPRAFALPEGELQRQDRPVIPQRVIREAIVNALMHRSYRSTSPVQVIRYSNRLEIRNPGFSLKSPEHLGEPGSQPRNPKIAAVLHDTRFAETKGSGIRVMRESMDQAGLTPPLFESDRGRDLFVARYLFHHFLGPDDIAWLAQFKSVHLSDDDAKALVFVKEALAIDNASYRELTGVDPLAASQALRRLRDAGLLEQKGRGSATYYVPTTKLLPIDEPVSIALSRKPVGLSGNLGGLSGNLGGLSTDPPMQSSKLPPDLPPALATVIERLGMRAPPGEVEAAIVMLCAWRELRTDELVALLARRAGTVRSYVTRLVQQGCIQQRYPRQPNHPQQAYRANTDHERD